MKSFSSILLLFFLIFLSIPQNTPPTPNSSTNIDTTLIPQSFQNQLTVFLFQLQNINSTQGKQLAQKLKKCVFQLYILLVDYHNNGPTTYQQINAKVIELLIIIDSIVELLHKTTVNNSITGSNNINYGINNHINGQNNTAVGIRNTANGANNTVTGYLGSTSGANNKITGSNQFVIGSNLTVSGGNNVVLIGKNLTNATNILSIGKYELNIDAAARGKNSILN